MKRAHAIVLLLIGGILAFAVSAIAANVVHRERGTWVFDRVQANTTMQADNYQTPSGSTYSASGDIDLSTLRSSGIFFFTPKGGIDLDLANESDLEAQDIGTTWTFVCTSAGTSAAGATFTDGATGVVVKTIDTKGTTCEDLGDQIDCTGAATELITCKTFCAD